jgi:citrate lyase subunit beta/citryl-CoA lyase
MQRKADARQATKEWLDGADRGGQCQLWVRVNSGDLFTEDVDFLAGQGIDGVVLPKLANAAETKQAIDVVTGSGLADKVIALIETARGVQHVDDIAQVAGVHQLMIGEVDLGGDLGTVPDDPIWDAIRIRLVIASAAAGIHPPIGPVDSAFVDVERLSADTQRLKRLGFASRSAIHPAQIAAIHAGLAPTDEEIARASDLVASFDDATSMAQGAYVGPDGEMVDVAHVKWARRILELADRGR